MNEEAYLSHTRDVISMLEYFLIVDDDDRNKSGEVWRRSLLSTSILPERVLNRFLGFFNLGISYEKEYIAFSVQAENKICIPTVGVFGGNGCGALPPFVPFTDFLELSSDGWDEQNMLLRHIHGHLGEQSMTCMPKEKLLIHRLQINFIKQLLVDWIFRDVETFKLFGRNPPPGFKSSLISILDTQFLENKSGLPLLEPVQIFHPTIFAHAIGSENLIYLLKRRIRRPGDKRTYRPWSPPALIHFTHTLCVMINASIAWNLVRGDYYEFLKSTKVQPMKCDAHMERMDKESYLSIFRRV